MLRIVSSAAAVLVLAGCASAPQIAKGEFGPRPAIAELVAPKETGMMFFRNGENCSQQMIPSEEVIKESNGKYIPLPPGEKIALIAIYSSLEGLATLNYCRSVAVFTPEENTHYALSLQVKSDKCLSQLQSREKDTYGEWEIVEDVDWRKFKTPMFSDGEFCEPSGVKPNYYLNQTGPINIYVPRP